MIVKRLAALAALFLMCRLRHHRAAADRNPRRHLVGRRRGAVERRHGGPRRRLARPMTAPRAMSPTASPRSASSRPGPRAGSSRSPSRSGASCSIAPRPPWSPTGARRRSPCRTTSISASAAAPPPERIEGRLVFIGYGLHIPEAGHDDFAGVDLRGAIAVVISGGPANISGALKSHARDERGRLLVERGAVGLIAITTTGQAEAPWERTAPVYSTPARHVFRRSGAAGPRTVARRRGQPGGGRAALRPLRPSAMPRSPRSADASRPVPGFALNQIAARRPSRPRAAACPRPMSSAACAAAIRRSPPSMSCSPPISTASASARRHGDAIHNGTLDNAAGVASLLDIAARYRRARVRPRRSILFVALTGEERGLLGSRYFARRPSVPRRIDRRQSQLRHGAAALPADQRHRARRGGKQPRRRRARGRRGARACRSTPIPSRTATPSSARTSTASSSRAFRRSRSSSALRPNTPEAAIEARVARDPLPHAVRRSRPAGAARGFGPAQRFHRRSRAARRQCRASGRAGTRTASSAASPDPRKGRLSVDIPSRGPCRLRARLRRHGDGAAAGPARRQEPTPKGPPADREPQMSVTRHSGTFGGQRVNYTATAGEIFLRADNGTPRAAIFYTSYVARAAQPQPAGHLPVQRRPRLRLGLAAHGRLRAAPGRDPLERHRRRRAALSDRPQSGFAARRHRSRLHRSGRHRLQPRARRHQSAGFLGRHRRRPLDRPVHPPVAQRQWPLEQPQIPRRRELWHDPLRGGAQPARRPVQRCRAERRHPDLDRARFRRRRGHARQRDDPCPQPAVDGRDRALSRQARRRARSRRSSRRRGAGRWGPISTRWCRAPRCRRRSGPPSAANWPASPASPRSISSAPTCASRRPASIASCCATAAFPSAGSTAAIPAATIDSAGEEPDNDPSFYGIDAGYTAAINQHMREVLGFRTDRSYVTIGPVGPWDWRLGGRAATATPISTSRPISAGRCGRIAASGSSSARAITISPRPSSPPNIRCRAPASRATASSSVITARAT